MESANLKNGMESNKDWWFCPKSSVKERVEEIHLKMEMDVLAQKKHWKRLENASIVWTAGMMSKIEPELVQHVLSLKYRELKVVTHVTL